MPNTRYDSRQWARHLITFRGSVARHIAWRIGMFTGIAAFEVFLFDEEVLPAMPLGPHMLIGTALGLLLTFRTNSGYERFWEGRKAWGSIVNRSRNIVRQACTDLTDVATRQRIARLTVSFVHAAKRQMWKEGRVPELDRLMGPEEAPAFYHSPGPAQRCLLEIGRTVVAARQTGGMHPIDQSRLEEDLATLIDQLGACERIQKTPIPIGYVLHLRRFLAIYCATLGLGLEESMGWFTPAAVAFISYALLGIEQIGVEIEDPFEHDENDIDLESITRAIERDLLAMAEIPTETKA